MVMPAQVKHSELSPEAIEWLQSRGIQHYANLRSVGDSIGFPYFNSGEAYAWKMRATDKKHFWCAGSPQTFWSPVPEVPTDIVIVEGEMDALSFYQAGIVAWSVPHGAPSSFGSDSERRLRCVELATKHLANARKVILATDNDTPGQALAEQLARMIGRAKCYQVKWDAGCKDANDVLVKFGSDGLKRLLDNAEPWPITGLHRASEFSSRLQSLYKEGLSKGCSTGWAVVDQILTIKPGMLHIVTGVPSSGKSTWLNALLVNLARSQDWRCAMASFENPIDIHIAKLCSHYLCKPFGSVHMNRMTNEEMIEASTWVDEHFMFLSQDETSTVASLIDRFKIAVHRQGIKAVVVDPFNFIRLSPSRGECPETEAINHMLAEFKLFAVNHDVAFFLVAHPAKPSIVGNDWRPRGYDISGSAHWYNRADFGVTIHRRKSISEVLVWKARFDHLGKEGSVELEYDPVTGQFVAPEFTVADPFS
jgi:twinkle protein